MSFLAFPLTPVLTPAAAAIWLPLTLTTAALCVSAQLLLTALVIAQRARTGIGLLDGGNHQLARRIRAHGNFTETVPIALLLMLLLELAGVNRWVLVLSAILLIGGRLFHAIGVLHSGDGLARRGGMVATLLAHSVLAAAAATLLWRAM